MATLTFQQGVNGYTSAIDTKLQQASRSAAAGTATTNTIDFGTGVEVQSLLAFDNLFGEGQGQIPIGAKITSATLTLRTTNSSAQGGSLYRMLSDWDTTATWNSFGNGVQTDGWEATFFADLVTGAVGLGDRAFDVTASLQAWAAAGTTNEAQNAANQGWLFNAGGTDAWVFSSSDGSAKPLLTVTYTTDEIAPIAGVTVTQTNGSTAVAESGTSDSFTVALNSAPTATVTISIAGNNIDLSADTLTFTPANWQIPQTVRLSAVNDSTVEGTETSSLTLTASSTDAAYNGVTINPLSATIFDNDSTAPPIISASVVNVTRTTTWGYKKADAAGYGNSDPSGLAYVPSLNALLIADSEHDEGHYSSSSNLFAARLDGTAVGAFSLTGFTKEPTGLGYNPRNGLLYIADDNEHEVFWVDPARPSIRLGSFDTARLGFTDTEDLKVDPASGHLFILDGERKRLFELTDQSALVGSVKLPSVMTDAEALAYDPIHDVFFIASGASSKIWEMDPTGKVLATINVLGSGYSNPVTGVRPAPKGLELAPSSDPADGSTLSLFVADYGVDETNDGRLFEISLGSDWLIA
jgi:hypothetical protein